MTPMTLSSILDLRNRSEKNTDLLAKDRTHLIYGTGSCAMDVFKFLSKEGYNVEGFINNIPANTSVINGLPVVAIDSIISSRWSPESTTIVLGLFNPYAPVTSIINKLKTLGYMQTVTFVELHRRASKYFGNRYWLTDLAFYNDKKIQIEQALALFTDTDSIELFKKVLQFRFTANYEFLPPLSSGVQYFDSIFPLKKPVSFVDCGAFTGDTITDLFGITKDVRQISAFEPDLANFEKLSKLTSELEKTNDTQFSLFPCGVWSRPQKLNFTSGDGLSSHVGLSGGNDSITCVSLDKSLVGHHPSFIKMDIEGAEHEALRGAINLIQKNTPDLAISAYHQPADLWEIPILINSLNENYHFCLRQHGHSGFDLVLYAHAY